MKILSLVLAMLVYVSSASAMDIAFPDFTLAKQFEKTTIISAANVKAYVKALGGTAYSVKETNKGFVVVTNNGKTFGAKVVYAKWPKVAGVALTQAK